MDSLVGIGFKPTGEEIVHLLKKKRLDPDFSVPTIKEIDFYKFEPWELPGFSAIQSKEEVWYFYCEPNYLCAKNKPSRRKTKTGNWKVTGKGSEIKTMNRSKVIGTKTILTFRSKSIASKKAKTEWVMHEIAVEDDSLYKKDFVVCRLERKRVTKRGNSNSDGDQSSQDLASCSNIDVAEASFPEFAPPPPDDPMVFDINHGTENIFSKNDNLISYFGNHVAENIGPDIDVPASDDLICHSRNHVAENISLESIPPPNQYLISNRNHVAENTILVSQVPPSDHLISYSRNHVAENTCAVSQVLPSQSLGSSPRNHVAEIACPESQQLANDLLISCSRNHVVENSSTKLHLLPNDNLESLILPNQHSVSYSTNIVGYTFEAEPQLFTEFNPHGGYNGLNDTSFSALQSPIYPEQESSYANGSSYDCDLLNSAFYSEQINDLLNSLRAFQNESPLEEPGQTFTPDFNSSKSDECSHESTRQNFSHESTAPNFSSDFNLSKSVGGLNVENSSYMDTETCWDWCS